jgi:hypothetical protein
LRNSTKNNDDYSDSESTGIDESDGAGGLAYSHGNLMPPPGIVGGGSSQQSNLLKQKQKHKRVKNKKSN